MKDLNTEEQGILQREYEDIVNIYKKNRSDGNFELIEKAFHFACEAHKGVRRRSGEPYIYHPVAVARIVVEDIGLGATSIASAFLHDVVEDTDYTVEDMENLFGARVAKLVSGLTKLSGGVFNQEQVSMQSENFRRLLLTMSDDIRVILVKIADRLHNMRTLEHMPARKQYKIAAETLYLYAPLAHRLGLFRVKSELENLGFKYEHPSKYEEIRGKIEAQAENNNKAFDTFIKNTLSKLERLDIIYTLEQRIKTPYSVWKKMEKRKIKFEDINDVLAIRIVFENRAEKDQDEDGERAMCWQIYSHLTTTYKPRHGRMRDFLTTPKVNGYEALHNTLLGDGGLPIEVQIRSVRMNEIAEKGCAAHWKYKTDEQDESELDKWLSTIRELLETPEANAIEFIDDFKLDLFDVEIFVFTPKGDVKILPRACTVLDFAFDLHSDLGLRCIGAKINHKLVSINHVLKSGDQVEVLTSTKEVAKREWLDWVTTTKAKSILRSTFRKERHELEQRGSAILRHELKMLNVPISSQVINKLVTYYKLSDQAKLMRSIGSGDVDLLKLPQAIAKKPGNKLIKYWRVSLGKFGSSSRKGNSTKLPTDEEIEDFICSPCCKPIPGDDVIVFKDKGRMYIHKRGCDLLRSLSSKFGENIVDAEWTSVKKKSFLAIIELEGKDEIGLVTELTRIVSQDYSIDMSTVHFESNNGVFKGFLHIYVPDSSHLNRLIATLSLVKGVSKAVRGK